MKVGTEITRTVVQAFGFWLIALFCFTAKSYAQNPYCVVRDDESGLPSNEVYSIVQDNKGFIWLGCDAGLYRYNGVQFQGFRSPEQQSKSISGLCFSTSGTLYCRNFKNQIFYLSNGRLKELKHSFNSLYDISTDLNDNVVVSHGNGISLWNEHTRKWTTYANFGTSASYVLPHFTKSAKANGKNVITFVSTEGIGTLNRNKVSMTRNGDFKTAQLGATLLANHNGESWVFSGVDPIIYRKQGNRITRYHNLQLEALLRSRKITNVKSLPDGNLWIYTYTGIIRFNPKTARTDVFFTQYSFSDGTYDENGDYWFSTLHNGILMVPDFRSKIWDSNVAGLSSEKITKVTTDGESVYFATGNGQLGSISVAASALRLFNSGNGSDIQSMYADPIDGCLYVAQNNQIFALQNNRLSAVKSGVPSVKNMLHIPGLYCFASSNGLLVCENTLQSGFKIVNREWNRDLCFLNNRNELWVATNNGILVYKRQGNILKQTRHFFPTEQILSIEYKESNDCIYALVFDGRVVAINPSGKTKTVNRLPENVQGTDLQLQGDKLFVCTSNGVRVFSLVKPLYKRQKWTSGNGLVSNNIQECCFTGDLAWLATGKGLQQFDFGNSDNIELGTVGLSAIELSGKQTKKYRGLNLQQGDGLTLFPEYSMVSKFGDFEYAYRFKNRATKWSFVPGTATEIFIPSVPDGDFEIELRVFDRQGNVSENAVVVSGYMTPPFYRSTWFLILSILIVVMLGTAFYLYQVKRLKRKQQAQIERLQLESDLRLTQQTALKAQMNPHFIFNVLNSIKGFIYKNDKVKAATYLSDFSDLIRGILDMSSAQYVSLATELAFLKTYVELESMMLGEEFEFQLETDNRIDSEGFEVPTLLIQPFIENAFKHGLQHQSGKRKLLVAVNFLRPNQVVIEIADNGIGRKASEEVNKQHAHRSFATGAIEKRIALINREGKMNVSVDIKDNQTGDKRTVVTVSITNNESEE